MHFFLSFLVIRVPESSSTAAQDSAFTFQFSSLSLLKPNSNSEDYEVGADYSGPMVFLTSVML